MSEKKLTQSSSIVNKLMFGSQNLYEIISGTKYFDDKWGIGFEEGVSTSIGATSKFVRSTTQELKLKLVFATPKGKLFGVSHPLSFSKVNTSSKASSSWFSYRNLLPLPNVPPMCDHYGECGLLKPHCRKLTSYPYMGDNMSISSTCSLLRATPWSERLIFSHSYSRFYHLCVTTENLTR